MPILDRPPVVFLWRHYTVLVIVIVVTAFPTGSTNDNSGNSKAFNSRVETEIENPLFGPWPSGHPFDLVARCDRTRDNLLLLQ